MKYSGFDGRQYSLQSKDFIVYNDDIRQRSDLHIRARALIKSRFQMESILEEVSLPVYHKSVKTLYADFLLPSKKIMVEVQGQQHTEFSPFFHGSKSDFVKSQLRDSIKKSWCEMNNIRLVELPYNESDEQWESRLRRI